MSDALGLPPPHRIGDGLLRPYRDRTIDDPLPPSLRFLLGAYAAQGIDPEDAWVALGGRPRPSPPADPRLEELRTILVRDLLPPTDDEMAATMATLRGQRFSVTVPVHPSDTGADVLARLGAELRRLGYLGPDDLEPGERDDQLGPAGQEG